MVAIYNCTTGNAHKHMASTHPSLHLARKRQSLEPKQLISISTSAFTSTNNIRAFVEGGNNAIIEHVHALVAKVVVNHKAPLLLATNVELNNHLGGVVPEVGVVRSDDTWQDGPHTHLHVLQVHRVRQRAYRQGASMYTSVLIYM